MIAQELEVCLHMAFVNARQDRHEVITVEHLLLAVLDSPAAAKALEGTGNSRGELRKALADHIALTVPCAAPGQDFDTQPSPGFQRVIQRAILQVQSSGKKEVTGADVLAAMSGEKGSHAARLLNQHGLARPGQAVRNSGDQPASGEQLLLALLDNAAATRVLRGCGVKLHSLRRDLVQHLSGQPSAHADRQADRDPDKTGADALVAILNDKDSPASKLLAQHGITRFDAVFYLTHGVAPASASYEADLPEGAELQVVLYNDDYTPMEFVVSILEKFFSMTRDDATEAMLEVHRKGVALCGLYSRDEAVKLMKNVLDYARQHGHPLNCGVLASKLP
jgi:ATP-dependent Clp protease adapter protein ClpS